MDNEPKGDTRMEIKTSRYANKELSNSKYYAVGISVGLPKFKLGYEVREQCYALAPRYDMLKLGYEQYRTEYFKKLDKMGTDKVIRIVQQLERHAYDEGKQLVLLCFEDIRKPGEWCHRTLFAEWWLKHTGEVIEELESAESLPQPKRVKKVEPEYDPEEYRQTCLFW